MFQILKQGVLYLILLCKELDLPNEKKTKLQIVESKKKWYFHSYFDLSAGKRSDTSVRVELLYSDTIFCLLVPI